MALGGLSGLIGGGSKSERIASREASRSSVVSQIAGLQDVSARTKAISGLQQLGGPFSDFFGGKDIALEIENKTARATELLQQLAAGTSPEELGLFDADTIIEERESIQQERERVLFGDPGQGPLDRLQEGILGVQAAQGFGISGGSLRALQTASAPSQIAALRAGIFNPEEGRTAGLQGAGIAGFFQDPTNERAAEGIRAASAGEGRFNIFNPPPFFELL